MLRAGLCFSAPWSVQCPPRLFVQTLWRRHHKQRESTDDTGDKEYLQTLRQLPFAPSFTFTCYPLTLHQQRLIMTVLKGAMTHFCDYHAKKCSLSKSTTRVDLTGTLRSSASALPLLPGCSAPRLPACSPSAPGSPDQIIYSSSPSRKRLEQSAYTHTVFHPWVHCAGTFQMHAWLCCAGAMTVGGGGEPLKEALPQWAALLSAAFYRPGPVPPTPTHTGSTHVSCTLPLWFTHGGKKVQILQNVLDVRLHSDLWLLTSLHRCRKDILSAGQHSAPLLPKCHLLMRRTCEVHPGRKNTFCRTCVLTGVIIVASQHTSS